MAQLTIYLPDAVEKKVRADARRAIPPAKDERMPGAAASVIAVGSKEEVRHA